MAWNSKYWDIIENLYWTPRYIGLKSIPRDKWTINDDRVSIPKELIKTKDGPLYFRSRKAADLKSYLQGQEEILNHLFNLTFSIAADDVISQALCKPLGFEDSGPFESIGRDVGERYGWRAQENVTQQDGFFISPKSLIGVELKLGVTSSAEQVAKYMALMEWEEQKTGHRDHLGLLFVVPNDAAATLWTDVGCVGGVIAPAFVDRFKKLPPRIRELFDLRRDSLKAVASRLRLGVLSWTQFQNSLVSYRADLDNSKPGDQTLGRLLDGLHDQIRHHGKTGIAGAGELVSAETGI